MGHGLRNHDEFEVVVCFIEYPMVLARANTKSLPLTNVHILTVFLKCGGSVEDKEKLLCVNVKMEALFSSWWHTFLDNTQSVRSYEVPAIAIVTPLVMRCKLFIDQSHPGNAILSDFAVKSSNLSIGFRFRWSDF